MVFPPKLYVMSLGYQWAMFLLFIFSDFGVIKVQNMIM